MCDGKEKAVEILRLHLRAAQLLKAATPLNNVMLIRRNKPTLDLFFGESRRQLGMSYTFSS